MTGRGDAAPARGGHGEVGPFEGFVPGIATAGALAAELERVVRGRAAHAGSSIRRRARWIDDSITPAAAASRAAHPPPDRVAFDAATLLLAELYAPEATRPRTLALCKSWSHTPAALRELGAIARMLGAEEAVARVTRALGEPPPRPGDVIESLEDRLSPDFSLIEALAEGPLP
ncbi:MAG TPA: hypothetical protein VLS89_18210 [Candidatus Nanopelagicales bacterium]|nr:hypothetical protein [Candidatus Nanopelagicales bacterium]